MRRRQSRIMSSSRARLALTPISVIAMSVFLLASVLSSSASASAGVDFADCHTGRLSATNSAQVRANAANAWFKENPDAAPGGTVLTTSEAGTVFESSRPAIPLGDWVEARDCSWWEEMRAITGSIQLPTPQVVAGTLIPLTSPDYDSSDTYLSRLDALAASLYANPQGSAGPPAGEWRQSLDLLPAWRWSSVVSPDRYAPEEPSWFRALPGAAGDFLIFIFFAFSAILWGVLKALFWMANSLSDGIFVAFGSVINAAFAGIAKSVETFIVIAFMVVVLSVVRAFLSSRKVGEAVRGIAALLVFSAVFFALASNSSRATNQPNEPAYQLAPGTAAWAGKTMVGLTDNIMAPVTQRVGSLQLFDDGAPAGTAPTSCEQYSSVLHAMALEAGVPGTLSLLSKIWEGTYLSAFQRAQFGPNLEGALPSYAVCHLADEKSSVPPLWRHSALSSPLMFPEAAEAYDSRAVFFRYHTGRGVNGIQPAEAAMAAAACRYVDGEWQLAPQFSGAEGPSSSDCDEIFRTEHSGELIGSKWGPRNDGPANKRLQLFGGDDELEDARKAGDEVYAMGSAMSPAPVGMPGIAGAFSAVLGALAVTYALVPISIALLIAAVAAVFAVGFLFPVLLVLLAVQSKKAKAVGRLTGSLLVVNALVQAIMAFILVFSSLVKSIVLAAVPAGGGWVADFVGELIAGLSPAIAVAVLALLAKRAGFGGMLSGGGLLNAALLPAALAASMSGVKSLQDMAKVDNEGNNALLRKLSARGGKSAEFADKLKDQNLTSYGFGALSRAKEKGRFKENEDGSIEGKGLAGKAWAGLHRASKGSQIRRDFDNEKKNRPLMKDARKIARELGEPQPKSMADVDRLKSLKATRVAQDQLSAMNGLAKNGAEQKLDAKEAGFNNERGSALHALSTDGATPEQIADAQSRLERANEGLESVRNGRAALQRWTGEGVENMQPSSTERNDIRRDHQALKGLLVDRSSSDSPTPMDFANPAKNLASVVADATNGSFASGTGSPEAMPRELSEVLRSPDAHYVDAGAADSMNSDFKSAVVKTQAALQSDRLHELGAGYSSVAAMKADSSGSQEEIAERTALAARVEEECASKAYSLEIGGSGRSLAALYNGAPLSADLRSQAETIASSLPGAGTVVATSRGTLVHTDAVFAAGSGPDRAAAIVEQLTATRTPAEDELLLYQAARPESYLPEDMLDSKDPYRIEAVLVEAGFATVSGNRVDMNEFLNRYNDPEEGVREVLQRIDRATGTSGAVEQALRDLDDRAYGPESSARSIQTRAKLADKMEESFLLANETDVKIKLVEQTRADGSTARVVSPESIMAPVTSMMVECDRAISAIASASPEALADAKAPLEAAARARADELKNAVAAVLTASVVHGATTRSGVEGSRAYEERLAELDHQVAEVEAALERALEDPGSGAFSALGSTSGVRRILEVDPSTGVSGAIDLLNSGISNQASWPALAVEDAVTVRSSVSRADAIRLRRSGRRQVRAQTVALQLSNGPRSFEGVNEETWRQDYEDLIVERKKTDPPKRQETDRYNPPVVGPPVESVRVIPPGEQ